jgi:hypothetical protein
VRVTTPGSGANPYRIRLSELQKFRPMTAQGHSPLDPADDDDLLPTSTGQVLDVAEERPSMLTVEGEIWGFGKVAQYAATGTGTRAAAARIWVLLLLAPLVLAIVAEIAHLIWMH